MKQSFLFLFIFAVTITNSVSAMFYYYRTSILEKFNCKLEREILSDKNAAFKSGKNGTAFLITKSKSLELSQDSIDHLIFALKWIIEQKKLIPEELARTKKNLEEATNTSSFKWLKKKQPKKMKTALKLIKQVNQKKP